MLVSNVINGDVMRLLIREKIKEKGMTNKEVAEILGIDQNTVSRYTTGRIKLSLEMAAKIAEILECKVDDLYDD